MVETLDVTPRLQVGENEIVVTLGDGWHRGSMGYDQNKNVYGTDVALLCQLEVNGETALVTDETWEASNDGPLGRNDLMAGEEYDATRAETMTYHGVKLPDDPYLKDWKSDDISVREGLEISSNQVFRYLVCRSYENDQERFIGKFHEYGLGNAFEFDLIGLASPEIPMPGDRNWSGTTLPTISYGYSIRETPLHIAMFYNAIANGGKLMKPYLVQSIERDGKAEQTFSPVILNGSICSPETADSLKSALRSVVTDGTGRRLKDAKCNVAGKTGTARILVNFTRNGRPMSAYQDDEGRRRHQGTFVGFFPAEDPEYTAIVVVYSKLSRMNFYGGTIPANVLKEIINSIYCLSPGWGGELEGTGKVPEMSSGKLETGTDRIEHVPDIKGLGLKDAIYSLENCGYRYEYQGCGHVAGQTPKAGTKAAAGSTVKFILK